jgi:hypothetical protein
LLIDIGEHSLKRASLSIPLPAIIPVDGVAFRPYLLSPIEPIQALEETRRIKYCQAVPCDILNALTPHQLHGPFKLFLEEVQHKLDTFLSATLCVNKSISFFTRNLK